MSEGGGTTQALASGKNIEELATLGADISGKKERSRTMEKRKEGKG